MSSLIALKGSDEMFAVLCTMVWNRRNSVPTLAQGVASGIALVCDAAQAPAGLLSQDEVLEIDGTRLVKGIKAGDARLSYRAMAISGWMRPWSESRQFEVLCRAVRSVNGRVRAQYTTAEPILDAAWCRFSGSQRRVLCLLQVL